MLEMISAGQTKVEQILAGIEQEIAVHSPTIQAVTGQHLAAREGKIRGRAALQLLASQFGPHDQEAAVALAVSCELTYIANKIHNEVYYLDDFALRAGAAHLRILAGDYLFSLSSAYVAQSNNITAMKAAIDSLARVSEASLNITYDHLYQRLANGYTCLAYDHDIRGRVGSIFRAAAETGSILANLPGDVSEQIVEYGYDLGMTAQLAKAQAQLQQREPGWLNLPVEAAEAALVMYNELRAQQASLPPLCEDDVDADPARALSEAVQRAAPYHPQIMRLIEEKKQSHFTRALARISSLPGLSGQAGFAGLVELASQNRFN